MRWYFEDLMFEGKAMLIKTVQIARWVQKLLRFVQFPGIF